MMDWKTELEAVTFSTFVGIIVGVLIGAACSINIIGPTVGAVCIWQAFHFFKTIRRSETSARNTDE